MGISFSITSSDNCVGMGGTSCSVVGGGPRNRLNAAFLTAPHPSGVVECFFALGSLAVGSWTSRLYWLLLLFLPCSYQKLFRHKGYA